MGLFDGGFQSPQGAAGLNLGNFWQGNVGANLGGGIGSFLGGGSDAKGKVKSGSTTTASPWGPQATQLENLFNTAGNLSQTPLQYYPGSTVAGFTPDQLNAQNLTRERALSGSPLVKAAQGYTQDLISGKYLSPDSNPFLRDTYNRALETSMPQLSTAAVGSGRSGSDMQALIENDLRSRLATDIYGGAYNTERGYQNNAVNFAPTLANQDYYDIGNLAALGQDIQSMNQANINDQINRFQFNQLEPWQRATMTKNLVSGDYGGTTSSQSQRGRK